MLRWVCELRLLYVNARTTSALFYIHKHNDFKGVIYVDDLAGVEIASRANDAFVSLGRVIDNAGLLESKDKACAPSTLMTFLGIEFDTVNMERRIPDTKLVEV